MKKRKSHSDYLNLANGHKGESEKPQSATAKQKLQDLDNVIENKDNGYGNDQVNHNFRRQ